MAEYAPPLEDVRFVLDQVIDLDGLLDVERFNWLDAETVHGAVAEAGRFFAEVIAPLRMVGDREGSQLQPDGTIKSPTGFREAYRKLVDAGWGSLVFDPAHGGGGFPETIGLVLQEFMVASNMGFSMCPLLSAGAIHAIESVADELITETYLDKLVSGEWAGTMNLTEPEAGSDVGALRTKAEPVGDGTFRISGQKIFISWGDHDLTDNIVHLVLARTPGAPPGTKGISCFIVPKFMVNDDGSLGAANDVKVVSIEHKMGIHASPTCVMSYGDNDGAIGWLLGNEFDGMRVMFVMMNMARLGVGIQGLGLGEHALQLASEYAKERVQGRAPGAPKGASSPIVDHPDVRRMLLTLRAMVEAMRLLCYVNAAALDRARVLPDVDERQAAAEFTDLLIPITKSWCTDMGIEATSLAVQIYGGMGYIEESTVPNLYRDARISSIYEGTNGIQALDLVGRKLPMRMGGVISDLIADIRATVSDLEGSARCSTIAPLLANATDDLDACTQWIFQHGGEPIEVMAGATPFQRLAGNVVGGWLLARSALAAEALGSDGGEGFSAEFCQQKIVTARYFAEQFLPQTGGLRAQVTSGSATLMESTF